MTAAKMILHDWQRGKIPFFVPPPQRELPSEETTATEVESDTLIDNNQASAFRAIANVISSQQQMSVPVQRDLYNENELKGSKTDDLGKDDVEAEKSEKSVDSDGETSENSEDSDDEVSEQSSDAEDQKSE